MMKYFVTACVLLFTGGCATIPPRPPAPQVIVSSGVYHTVEKGQTLWRIARMYNIELKTLMAANGLSDPAKLEAGARLVIPPAPAAPAPIPPSAALTDKAVEQCVAQARGRGDWRTITLHHSATRYGNAKVFDRSHRSRGMGGLFYHFLIGNGNGLGDGKIEVGWRWKQQREVNRPKDIQICLVGNFMKQQVTDKQYDSMKKLVTALEKRYGIHSVQSVCLRRHCDIAKKPTECPGKNFPYSRLLRDVGSGK